MQSLERLRPSSEQLNPARIAAAAGFVAIAGVASAHALHGVEEPPVVMVESADVIAPVPVTLPVPPAPKPIANLPSPTAIELPKRKTVAVRPPTVPRVTTKPLPLPSRKNVESKTMAKLVELVAPPNKPLVEYDAIKERLPIWLEKIPTLIELEKKFPRTFVCAEKETQFINELMAGITITPEDYKNFTINTKHMNAFAGQGEYDTKITADIFVVHWTAGNFETVEDFINYMRSAGKRVQFFIDNKGEVWQLFDSDTRLGAHAQGVNSKSSGVEINAKGLHDLTEPKLKSAMLLALHFMHRNKREVSPSRIMGHYAADLLFTNPYYVNDKGVFRNIPGKAPASIRKIDPPQELMNHFLVKCMQLDGWLKLMGQP